VKAAAENDPKTLRKTAIPQGRAKEEIRKLLQYQCRIEILVHQAHHRLDLDRMPTGSEASAD
jgi:hypothetical protein